MVTITEETVITSVLTEILGRAPSSDEVAAGKYDAGVMVRVQEVLNTGTSVHSITTEDDIQEAIDDLAEDGNGILHFQAGTWDLSGLTDHIYVPSGVNLKGTGTATILDFGGTAFGIRIIGTDEYTTGTVTIANGGTEVVGSSTVFFEGMVGEYIFLEDLWYEITAFTDTTHITIGDTYAGNDLSGSAYVIATIVSSVEISGMTLQNSTTSLIKVQYAEDVSINDVLFYDATGAIDADDCGSLFIDGPFISNCTAGIDLRNCWFGELNAASIFNLTGGAGINCNIGSNWLFAGFSMENITGNGITFTSWGDTAISGSTIKQITGKGIEFVSGNDTVSIEGCTFRYCSSDGVKFTATSDTIQMYGNNFDNNSGYGVNIADSTCDNIIIGLNAFASNASGGLNDAGTGTIAIFNSGL